MEIKGDGDNGETNMSSSEALPVQLPPMAQLLAQLLENARTEQSHVTNRAAPTVQEGVMKLNQLDEDRVAQIEREEEEARRKKKAASWEAFHRKRKAKAAQAKEASGVRPLKCAKQTTKPASNMRELKAKPNTTGERYESATMQGKSRGSHVQSQLLKLLPQSEMPSIPYEHNSRVGTGVRETFLFALIERRLRAATATSSGELGCDVRKAEVAQGIAEELRLYERSNSKTQYKCLAVPLLKAPITSAASLARMEEEERRINEEKGTKRPRLQHENSRNQDAASVLRSALTRQTD